MDQPHPHHHMDRTVHDLVARLKMLLLEVASSTVRVVVAGQDHQRQMVNLARNHRKTTLQTT